MKNYKVEPHITNEHEPFESFKTLIPFLRFIICVILITPLG